MTGEKFTWRPTKGAMILGPRITDPDCLKDSSEVEASFYFGGLASISLTELEKGTIPVNLAFDALDFIEEITLKFAPGQKFVTHNVDQLRKAYQAKADLEKAVGDGGTVEMVITDAEQLADVLRRLKKANA